MTILAVALLCLAPGGASGKGNARVAARIPAKAAAKGPLKTEKKVPSKAAKNNAPAIATKTPSKTAAKNASSIATKTPSKAAKKSAPAIATRTPSKTAAKARREKPREPPPPDPLAGAWPSREAPQLGDGTLRSEVLVAARRIVGLGGSFDEDSFVKHLAYVLDVARKSDLREDAWARTLVRRASSRGLLKKDTKARPGDLVVFSLDTARPRSTSASRLLVGVAESAEKGVVRFVAPLGDKVARAVARPGKVPNRDDTAVCACRAPEPPKSPAAGKGAKKKKGKQKAPRAARALPCRAGEMWIGRIPAESLAHLF